MTFEVTVPVLNEEVTLRRQVGILHAFLSEHFPGKGAWNIVIADNGSTDKTHFLAEKTAEELGGIRVIRTAKRGVGLALKTSWNGSKADIVGYMDLDLATDLKHFLEVMKLFENEEIDLIYGTRLHPQAEVRNRPLKREITSRIFNFILKNYLGTRFSDGMCGFKFLKRNKLNLLLQNGAGSDGWFFSTELAAVAEWQGLHLHELPIRWTDDISSSKVKIGKLAKEYLQAMKILKTKRP